VAVIPGAPFGAENHLRFTFTASAPDIEKGLARFASFVEKLEK
jgi:aspartate/methionine/tyrosine aminotransferase